MDVKIGRNGAGCRASLAGDGILVDRVVSHSFRVTNIALRYGWMPGARYTNLRDVRRFPRLGFLDIDWKNYNFALHLSAARETRPKLTVARDIVQLELLGQTLDEAHELSQYAEHVIVVPKDLRLTDRIEELIPSQFRLGYSVPTRYGGTEIPLSSFTRPVHLLGGRPDVQRRLAERLQVHSVDGNRFTLDASFGDYFDGEIFRRHPVGGYEACIEDSIKNINSLWEKYCVCDRGVA